MYSAPMTIGTVEASPVNALDLLRSVSDADRDRPPAGLEEKLRACFPTEAEYDLVLSRKLEGRRKAAPAAEGSFAPIAERLDGFLQATLSGGFTRTELRWLSGGGAKVQLAFDLTTEEELHGRHEHTLVLRMEPAESLNTTSRLREAQILTAMADVVPVPEVYWVDEAGEWFGEPALLYSFVPGVTKPRGTRSQVGGVGGRFEGALQSRLADQFVEAVARIHTVDVASLRGLTAFTVPPVGTTDSALWQVNRARRIWEEDRGEDLPYVEAAAAWLLAHLPALDRVSVLHGDYRTGNILFDEDDGKVTAWLDWERTYLGDRHRDLAWITLPQWGRRDDDGRLLVSGLIPLDEFLDRYQQLSGLTIDPERMRFYRVLNSYQLVVSTLGSAYRVSHLGRSHQDILLTWIEGFANSCGDELRRTLLEET
jgi:aminoglycoside phosphotransferase (APT) family kinase protein